MLQSFTELSVGDYVVHEDHGLGIYRGIEKIERDGVVKDYLKVEYADNGSLYLPATRLDGIQKYAGSDAKAPKLNKLGGEQWNRTKAKVKTAVKEIARDLVQLYAARRELGGYQYGEDTVWQQEFEELFPYEETEDQLTAIEDTKRDMESRRIMDRLICGDVGYGKTEIALRAAFKAVQESKQVVYLVPTTILAQQHYNTFVQRMKDFPVRIELMSRFRTPGQIKKTIEDLKNFRQRNSLTPGHPEYKHTTGVEVTTGPLGQGIANAVGMALAESHLAAKFNTPEFKVVDHYTYALCGDGCLQEGVASEAASLAGTMGLNKIIVLYDSNHITIEGDTATAFSEDVLKRFEAYGWDTQEVADGNDVDAI